MRLFKMQAKQEATLETFFTCDPLGLLPYLTFPWPNAIKKFFEQPTLLLNKLARFSIEKSEIKMACTDLPHMLALKSSNALA